MRYLLLAIFIIASTLSFSQSLTKGLNSINRGKYDVASMQLYGVLNDDPENPAAEFLLAKMYHSLDYPGYSLDSANKYILRSAAGLNKKYKEKELDKLQSSSGWREFTVHEMQDGINASAYHNADSINELN